MKSSGRACLRDAARAPRDETKAAGAQPSAEPTVLKYPAEKPPVKAPWSLRRPFSSRTCVGGEG